MAIVLDVAFRLTTYRVVMRRWLRHLRLPDWLSPAWRETSRLIVGATGSGKSEAELVDLVRLANRRHCAVVLLDGHGPLAFRAIGHWAARGHESRLLYEPLHVTDRVLAWSMLTPSSAADPSRRLLENAETREDIGQCFLAQRSLLTLQDKPWTKEWLDAALDLCLSQPRAEPLGSLLAAFRVRSPEYERLLAASCLPEVVAKFRGAETLRNRNPTRYEDQTGASRRLLEPVCTSEVVRLRSRPGSFDWLEALRERRLIAVDGGGIRSREIKRTVFLLVTLQVIHAVRRHFAETQEPLPVVLVLEEAGALGLVTPFVLGALQELRKAGLAIHLITQSSLDFPDERSFESLLAHTPWNAWYRLLAPADQEIAAKALANATFDPLRRHFTRSRQRHDGVSRVPLYGDRVALVPRYRDVAEPHYQTPSLQEQEYRTRLATLDVGERWVRDRRGVRQEYVRPLRSPWRHEVTDSFIHSVIARVRRQPFYQAGSPPPADGIPPPSRSAAPRLWEKANAESPGVTTTSES